MKELQNEYRESNIYFDEEVHMFIWAFHFQLEYRCPMSEKHL